MDTKLMNKNVDKIVDAVIALYDEFIKNETFMKFSDKALLNYAKRSYKILTDFKYNIGIIGIQSSGKSTLVNTLLGYPYMPLAGVETTCAISHIRYDKKMHIVVENCDERDRANEKANGKADKP